MSEPVAAPAAELKPIDISTLDFVSLACSRVCHDAVNPVGAIINGFELLEMESTEEGRATTLQFIRESAENASAKLQFARIAFGAGGGAGASVELGNAHQLIENLFKFEKASLEWHLPRLYVGKNQVKLLMNLVLMSLKFIPMGGVISVTMAGDAENPEFTLIAKGPKPRIEPTMLDLLEGRSLDGNVDAYSYQIFFTGTLARAAHMALTLELDQEQVCVIAKPKS